MEAKQNLQAVPEKEVKGDNGSELKRPDQGWAWVVASAACTINFIMAGLVRMSGILFVAFIEIFQVDRKSASMPFSVRSSAGNLFGPVVGILGQKYGVRKVIVTGCIIGTISSAACFFAPDVMWITVLWGGISGLGSALTVTLPQVVIGQHFDKYRTTAAGMAYSGGCIGSFLFPVLLEYLLHNYGIQGTFLIIAGILMHTIPAALILRKPQWLKSKSAQKTLAPKPIMAPSQDKVENQASIDNSKVFSVNECTPKRSNIKFSRRDLVKETGIFKNCRVQIVNECSTPTKKSLNDSNVVFDLYPDVEYLKKHSELVRQLLTMKIAETNDATANEINQKEIAKFLEANILDVLDGLYHSVLSSQGKSMFHKNLRQVKSTLLQDEIKKDVKLNRSQSVKVKLHESNLYKVNSVPAKSQKSYNMFVLSKLSELDGVDEKEFAKLPGDKTKITSILSKLRKLAKLCPRVVEKTSDLPTTPSKMLDREKITYVKDDSSSNSFMHHVSTAFKLYSNPLFIMVCLCRAVHFLAFIPSMTTVVDFSMDKGLQEDEGKFAIAVISIGDLMGRLCFGWVTDRGFVTLPKYMMIVMVLQGISTAALPLLNSKITIFACLSIYGMLQGSLFVRHPVLISKYMRSHEQSIAMGCANLLSGVIGFGLPLYIGYFRDTLGSYDYVFYINGLFGACVGLLWVFEPFFIRFVNAKRTTQKIPV